MNCCNANLLKGFFKTEYCQQTSFRTSLLCLIASKTLNQKCAQAVLHFLADVRTVLVFTFHSHFFRNTWYITRYMRWEKHKHIHYLLPLFSHCFSIRTFISSIRYLPNTSREKKRKSISSYRQKYKHLLRKHVDETIGVWKTIGKFHITNSFNRSTFNILSSKSTEYRPL